MKSLIYICLMLLLAACAAPPTDSGKSRFPEGSGQLVLEIANLRNSQGEIYLSIFSGKQGFPDNPEAALVNHKVTIQAEQSTIIINDLPYGEYAVAVLHDENRDGKMNTSVVGVPKEGFGFSGNPKTKMGPPEYNDVRFLLLVPEKMIKIVLQYETVGRERQRIMQERKRQK